MTRREFLESVYKEYDLVGVLSQKNDSEILRLRNKALGKDIVLRSYPCAIEAYEKLKHISHPNIPLVFDVLTFEDGQIVIEEFVNGITVAQVLEEGKYSYHGAKKVITAVGNALIALHNMDIVHRDIKPENIIITLEGTVKLLDFNASRIYIHEKKTDTVVLGTIGYAAPEQFGISQSDSKSDIYALGVLLNVMLTSKHPSETLAKGKAGKIILKCTQIDPNSRFHNAEKFIEAL